MMSRPTRPLRVGLTGGIGAGKSLALDILRKKGVPTLQADRVARKLLEERAVRGALVRRFGKGILGRGGRINRKKLAAMAFRNPRTQKSLNGLIHPLTRRRIRQWVGRQAGRRPFPSLVVVEVPLLFENGFYRYFDRILSLSSSRAGRRRRLLRRGWTVDEIRRREALQLPQEEKNKRADWVLRNDDSKQGVERALSAWLGKLRDGLKRGAIRPRIKRTP